MLLAWLAIGYGVLLAAICLGIGGIGGFVVASFAVFPVVIIWYLAQCMILLREFLVLERQSVEIGLQALSNQEGSFGENPTYDYTPGEPVTG